MLLKIELSSYDQMLFFLFREEEESDWFQALMTSLYFFGIQRKAKNL